VITLAGFVVNAQNADAFKDRGKHRTVLGVRFHWLVLQHVSPNWFRRVRNFGFLHPN